MAISGWWELVSKGQPCCLAKMFLLPFKNKIDQLILLNWLEDITWILPSRAFRFCSCEGNVESVENCLYWSPWQQQARGNLVWWLVTDPQATSVSVPLLCHTNTALVLSMDREHTQEAGMGSEPRSLLSPLNAIYELGEHGKRLWCFEPPNSNTSSKSNDQ